MIVNRNFTFSSASDRFWMVQIDFGAHWFCLIALLFNCLWWGWIHFLIPQYFLLQSFFPNNVLESKRVTIESSWTQLKQSKVIENQSKAIEHNRRQLNFHIFFSFDWSSIDFGNRNPIELIGVRLDSIGSIIKFFDWLLLVIVMKTHLRNLMF